MPPSLLRRSRSRISASLGISVLREEAEELRRASARSSARGTIASRCPKRKFDSARPKSSGSFSRVVCETTRGPANDMSAPGSASDDVAEAREAREHAAGRRMREDGEHRAARLVELVDRADRLRELHEREDPLLHASAARRGDRDERNAGLRRALARTHELLPDDAPHRAAHEGEVHDGEIARLALDRRRAADDRVAEPRLDLRLGEPLRVRAAGRRTRADRPSAGRRPPRRTSPDRRAARSARAPARGSGGRTAGTRASVCASSSSR